jgi:hypothetical protein
MISVLQNSMSLMTAPTFASKLRLIVSTSGNSGMLKPPGSAGRPVHADTLSSPDTIWYATATDGP